MSERPRDVVVGSTHGHSFSYTDRPCGVHCRPQHGCTHHRSSAARRASIARATESDPGTSTGASIVGLQFKARSEPMTLIICLFIVAGVLFVLGGEVDRT